MMICCEKERTTPFCPECGNSLQEFPLENLLTYLHTESGRRERSDDPRQHATARVWNKWADALYELLEVAAQHSTKDGVETLI